jgi:hypothetical protein
MATQVQKPENSVTGPWCHSLSGQSISPPWTNHIREHLSTCPLDRWQEFEKLEQTELGQTYIPFIKRLITAFKKAKKTITDLEHKQKRVENWTNHGITRLQNFKNIKTQTDRLIPHKSEYFDTIEKSA